MHTLQLRLIFLMKFGLRKLNYSKEYHLIEISGNKLDGDTFNAYINFYQ